jgi:hypothetical protein
VPEEYRVGTLLFCRADKTVMLPSFEILVPSSDGAMDRELAFAIARIAHENGAPVQNVNHQACVDKARSELAEMFLRGGDAEFAVFIDADQLPSAQQVYDLLIMAKLSCREVLAAFASRKSIPSGHAHGAPVRGDGLFVGVWGPQQQVKSVGFGMVVVHRNAFRRIAGWSRRHTMHPWAVKDTHIGNGKLVRDFFRPILGKPNPGKKSIRTGAWIREYMSEDVSFCARVMASGGSIWATPAIWPGHVGRFVYGREHV